MGNSKPSPKLRHGGVSSSQSAITPICRTAIGVDVHRDILVCHCIRYDQNAGYRKDYQAQFGTGALQLKAFAQWCKDFSPDVVMMESTGILWLSPYCFLEDVNFTSKELVLINARAVKAVVGKKTDETDARRIAEFALLGRYNKSFVPPRIFRDQRQLARKYQQEIADFSRAKNRFNKMLNAVGFRFSSVVSDIHGKSARQILEAKLFGTEEDLKIALKTRNKQMKATDEEILDALNFACSSTMLEQLRDDRFKIDEIFDRAQRTFGRLKALQAPYQTQIDILMSIPGIKEISARLIFAELCDDLKSHFANSERFCSWIGICPGNNESAGKRYSGHSAKGNKWIRRTLMECANGISLMRTGPLYDAFRCFLPRIHRRRSIVAIAHKLFRIIYSCLVNGVAYVDELTRKGKSVRKFVSKRAKAEAHNQIENFIDRLVSPIEWPPSLAKPGAT